MTEFGASTFVCVLKVCFLWLLWQWYCGAQESVARSLHKSWSLNCIILIWT